MALLRGIALTAAIVLCGCVDSDFEERMLTIDMGSGLISTCLEAAQFGVTCGEFVQADVEFLVDLCESFGDEAWTSCALSLGKPDCAAVAQCAFPIDQGVMPPIDGGVPCMTNDECGANQVCVENRCKKTVQ